MVREPDFVDECYADKDLSLLKKLTLVIPTYNRNFYLSRCLWYHAHFPFGQIIVADSSPEEKKVVNRETVAKICETFGAHILYLEYEPESEKYGGDIYRKWGDAVQHVQTEYSQICTDKTFKMPVAQFKAIEYLDSHDDYISAKFGESYQFTSDGFTLFSNNSVSIVNDDPFMRFSDELLCTASDGLLLEIIRSNTVKTLYSSLHEYKIDDIRYGGLYLGHTGYLMGKSYFMNDSFSSVRDVRGVETNLVSVHTRRKGSDGSSQTRYPQLSNYEYLGTKMGRQYRERYNSALKQQLLLYTFKSEEEIDKYITTSLKYAIFTNYGWLPHNHILIDAYINISMASKIYSIIPEKFKQTLLKIFCHKLMLYHKKRESMEETFDLNNMRKICEMYDQYYLMDNPIF